MGIFKWRLWCQCFFGCSILNLLILIGAQKSTMTTLFVVQCTVQTSASAVRKTHCICDLVAQKLMGGLLFIFILLLFFFFLEMKSKKKKKKKKKKKNIWKIKMKYVRNFFLFLNLFFCGGKKKTNRNSFCEFVSVSVRVYNYYMLYFDSCCASVQQCIP